MKSLIFIIAFFLLSSPSLAYAKSFGGYKGAVYVRNYDGDTITFNLPDLHPVIGANISVRIKGIDTPEIRGKCEKEKSLANAAKKFVQNILENSWSIDLRNISRDKYFRIVADVIVDKGSVAEFLIMNDLAVPYDGGKKTYNWCD